MSGSVRDVCMSHQSDWIYYLTPIKFPVVKVNGIHVRRSDPDTVQNGHIYASIKEEEVLAFFIFYGLG